MKRVLRCLFLMLPLLAEPVYADQQMQQRLQAQMQKPDRHKFDLPRDAGRQPYETFVFLGVEEGMTVLDVGAYAGYTSEMLAAAVGQAGKVYAHNTRRVLERYAEGYYQRTMSERLANDRLPNVVSHIAPYESLGLDGEVDVAFLGNLLHDFYYRDGRRRTQQFLASIRRALKPGGVLGVMDHVGDSVEDNAKLHRIEPHIARGLLREAGFEIVGESELFANPTDDHTLMVYDELIYRRTDRFLFKAVVPAR